MGLTCYLVARTSARGQGLSYGLLCGLLACSNVFQVAKTKQGSSIKKDGLFSFIGYCFVISCGLSVKVCTTTRLCGVMNGTIMIVGGGCRGTFASPTFVATFVATETLL